MVMIIAEIGVNHGGNEAEAYKLIDMAVDAGADVCKFQKFKPIGTREPYAWLCLPDEAYPRLSDYCKEKGIGFACTAFEADDLEWLLKNTEMAFVKISSGEAANKELLMIAQGSGKEIIQSVATGDDYQYCMHKLLHVVPLYPTPPEYANLSRLEKLWCDGLSDHSGDIFVPLAAVALGAKIIEVHVTMDKSQTGPDHTSSLDPVQFKELVRGIRAIEKALA